MTGISAVRSRRLPASLSRRLMAACPDASGRPSIVTRHRLDRRDHFLIGDLVGGAGEGGVAFVHDDRFARLGVAAESVDQLLPFGRFERSKIHGRLLKFDTGLDTDILPDRTERGRSVLDGILRATIVS